MVVEKGPLLWQAIVKYKQVKCHHIICLILFCLILDYNKDFYMRMRVWHCPFPSPPGIKEKTTVQVQEVPVHSSGAEAEAERKSCM